MAIVIATELRSIAACWDRLGSEVGSFRSLEDTYFVLFNLMNTVIVRAIRIRRNEVLSALMPCYLQLIASQRHFLRKDGEKHIKWLCSENALKIESNRARNGRITNHEKGLFLMTHSLNRW